MHKMPPVLYLQRHFVTVLQKDTENMVSEYGSLKDIAPIEQKYFLSVRIGFILSIILTWIENGRRESLLQLQAITQHQLEYLMNTFE